MAGGRKRRALSCRSCVGSTPCALGFAHSHWHARGMRKITRWCLSCSGVLSAGLSHVSHQSHCGRRDRNWLCQSRGSRRSLPSARFQRLLVGDCAPSPASSPCPLCFPSLRSQLSPSLSHLLVPIDLFCELLLLCLVF